MQRVSFAELISDATGKSSLGLLMSGVFGLFACLLLVMGSYKRDAESLNAGLALLGASVSLLGVHRLTKDHPVGESNQGEQKEGK